MQKAIYLSAIIIEIVFLAASLSNQKVSERDDISIDSLRKVYSRSSDRWPAPTLDSDVVLHELDILPDPPIAASADSLKQTILLGRTLFFDPRLSGSNQISCSSCHNPDLFYTDGRKLALGHNHLRNTRSTPSLENVWAQQSLFWDGRAKSLSEQAILPISSSIEMHQNIRKLPSKLRKIKGYRLLFNAAYGTQQITDDKIMNALAVFQQTIASNKSNFDFFMGGLSSRLTDEEVWGLHLFRTKGRCMNCHNGPLFTDGKFHNLGQTFYGDPLKEDLGLYNTTKNPADVGKFKTPGLRNSGRTHPWFHRGQFDHLGAMMIMYNEAFGVKEPTAGQLKDPMFPKLSPHIKPLSLTAAEQHAIIAFIESLTSNPDNTEPPKLPE